MFNKTHAGHKGPVRRNRSSYGNPETTRIALLEIATDFHEHRRTATARVPGSNHRTRAVSPRSQNTETMRECSRYDGKCTGRKYLAETLEVVR